jgi:hypothetical protein
MKPVLKAPGFMLLKLRYDGPLSNFDFKFNLRRNIVALCTAGHFFNASDATHVAKVEWCSLKPAETRVESALVS